LPSTDRTLHWYPSRLNQNADAKAGGVLILGAELKQSLWDQQHRVEERGSRVHQSASMAANPLVSNNEV
jgi:hypothetical protein